MNDEPVPLDPLTVARTGKPNDALICPEGERVGCAAEPDVRSAWYDLPPERLLRVWQDVLQASPRVTLTEVDVARGRLVGEQRSRMFGFIDRFAVRMLSHGEAASYAAYSRSLAGYYDFGVNERRLRRWQAEVARRLAALDQ